MAYSWSTEAKAALAAGCPARPKAYIDVEVNGTGVWGYNIIDITGYVLKFDEIERASLAIDKSFQIKPYTLVVNNDSGYFTPNLMSGSRAKISNIWQQRPSGEADPRMCRLYISLAITLPNGTIEEQTIYRGKILDLNSLIARDVTCEITARDDFLDALDVTLASDEGGTDSIAYP